MEIINSNSQEWESRKRGVLKLQENLESGVRDFGLGRGVEEVMN